MYFRGGGLPEQEETTTTKTPVLLVGGSVKGEPIYFICSACLRGFPLAEIQPPAQAARELLRCFQEHVAQEHPESAEGDIPDAAA